MKALIPILLLLSASAAHAEIYTWKDARGTVHYTNSLHEIPARYLKKARVHDVATGKKGALATAHAGQATPQVSAAAGAGQLSGQASAPPAVAIPASPPPQPSASPALPPSVPSPAASGGDGVGNPTLDPPPRKERPKRNHSRARRGGDE